MYISPDNALRTIQELGLRYASKSWAAALRVQAKKVFEIDELVPQHLAELMVVISHARAKIMNVDTATLPALTEALPPDVVLAAAAVKGLELDTAVYQFDDSDLTEEMIREGAIAERDASRTSRASSATRARETWRGDVCGRAIVCDSWDNPDERVGGDGRARGNERVDGGAVWCEYENVR